MGVSNLEPGADGGIQTVPAILTGPVKSAVAEASDRARAQIAAGQPITAAPPAAATAPAPVAAPPAGQAPPAQQPPAVQAPAAPAAQPPVGETPEAKAAREQAEAAARAAETPEQKLAREQLEALQVELPVGETEEDHLIITAADPGTAEALQKLVEIAVEGRVLATEVDNYREQVAQIEEMREYADADVVGFTMDMLGTNLDAAKALTMYLLTQPTLYNAIKADLPKLADPTQFRLLASDARELRHTMAESANERIETSRVVRQNLADVQATVDALLPEEMTPTQRQQARRDCLRDLKDYADSRELVTLPVHQIPAVLSARLTALGVDPADAAARAVVASARRGVNGLPRRPVAATPPPPARPVAAPAKTGAAFVTSAAKRATLGAIPNAGAGAPSNGGGLVAPRDKDGKPLGIKDTIEWHREQRKKGVKLW